MKKSTTQKTHAFSFVEILIAIVCLAMVMIPLTTMFSSGSSGTIQNRNDILARQHAANLLDYSYLLSYDNDFLKPGSEKPVPAIFYTSGSDELLFDMEEMFTRTVSIEEVKPPNWKYSYKLITVVVSWTENNNVAKEQVMTGLVTNESS